MIRTAHSCNFNHYECSACCSVIVVNQNVKMIHAKVIKKVPGATPVSQKEKQGYIEDLSLKTKVELQEIFERQDKLLANSGFISRLPDKGARIKEFRERVAKELAKKDEVESACELLSGLKLGVTEEIEWTGKFSKEKEDKKRLDSDDESEEKADPLKLIATHSGVSNFEKKYKVKQPEESLIKPEDLEELKSEVGHKDEPYIKELCDILEKPREQKKELFRPNRTVKSGSQCLSRKKPLGPHWEVTAATPPPPVHGDTKLVPLQESLRLQKEQAQRLKEVQAKHAAERLASQMGIKMGDTLPDPALRSVYRGKVEESGSESEGEEPYIDLDHYHEEEDEEPEKDSAVFINIVDE